MIILDEVKRISHWLWSKRSEVAQMDYRDAFMAHLVLEIIQTSVNNDFNYASLYELHPIHPVDNRENTIKATNERAKKIQKSAERLLGEQKVSKESLAQVLPSTTYIRAIPDGNNGYYTFEGNGRVAALKQVFIPEDNISIELDVYHPKKLKQSQRKVRKLRKMFGMR